MVGMTRMGSGRFRVRASSATFASRPGTTLEPNLDPGNGELVALSMSVCERKACGTTIIPT